jgi:hypothetical protein
LTLLDFWAIFWQRFKAKKGRRGRQFGGRVAAGAVNGEAKGERAALSNDNSFPQAYTKYSTFNMPQLRNFKGNL